MLQPETAQHPSLPETAVTTPSNGRDAALAADVQAFLANHRLLCERDIAVALRGGIAHVSGSLRSKEERRLLRAMVSRVRGVYAVWDRLEVAGGPEPRCADIGCGATKQRENAIGIDRHPHAGVDVVVDLERGLPFGDHALDQVFAVHFLEHINNLVGLMNEIHRVLRPDGVLHVIVPNCTFVNAIADPTHVRFFHQQTFKYFCRPYPGLRPFRPLAISTTTDNIYADLEPVQAGEPLPDAPELARFFD